MSNHRLLILALLVSVSLSACSQPAAPPAAAPPAAAPGAAPSAQAGPPANRGFIGEQVDRAFAAASRELRTKNLELNDGVHINVNGHHVSTPGSGLPKAAITPQGDLLIDGKPIAINAAQRQQLLDYRNRIIGIAEAGMAIGAQGVDIASTALQGIGTAIFGGEQGQKEYEARIEAEGKKIEAQAKLLCTRLPPLLASQDALAASLPEFKPYATMTQSDIDNCGKDGDKGVAVTSD